VRTRYQRATMTELDPPNNSDTGARPEVLIIAGRGLQNFVHALAAFSALRMHHGSARIHFIIDPDLVAFASLSPYFDSVIERPSTSFRLAKLLRSRSWSMVCDLECSAQTAWAYRLAYGFGRKLGRSSPPPWSGHVAGCSFPVERNQSANTHIADRLLNQINQAGVHDRPPASLAWVSRAANSFSTPFSLDQSFILIGVDAADGSSGWSEALLGECCALIEGYGHTPVLIGCSPDPRRADEVAQFAPKTIDMAGHVSLEDIVFIGWAASGAIGYDNDTMHLIAAAGCRCILLYDPVSDAALTGHRGPDDAILRRHRIDAIAPAEAVQKLYVKAVA